MLLLPVGDIIPQETLLLVSGAEKSCVSGSLVET